MSGKRTFDTHCRDVEVRDCSVHTGDDAIVVKTTGQADGEVRGVYIRDCEMVTQDSALKIGTETTAGISGIRFERCRIPSCNRACTLRDVLLDDVDVRLSKWTGFGGGVFDSRPTAGQGLVPHDTPGIHIAHADRVRLRDTRVNRGSRVPEHFSHALACVDVTELDLVSFHGEVARPGIAAITREPGH